MREYYFENSIILIKISFNSRIFLMKYRKKFNYNFVMKDIDFFK